MQMFGGRQAVVDSLVNKIGLKVMSGRKLLLTWDVWFESFSYPSQVISAKLHEEERC